MQILLRTLAVLFGLAVLWTLWAVAFVLSSGLQSWLWEGPFGWATVIGWLLTLTLGPVAAIRLWQLRDSGRRLALIGLVYQIGYFLLGLVLWRSAEAPFTPILTQLLFSGVLVVILLSPAARLATR